MLFDELKFNLGILDTGQDADLEKIITRGQERIKGLAGVTLDFEAEGLAKSLCLNFCRYSFNNAEEYFEENFKSEILRLQLQSAVIDYAANQT